MSDPRPASDDIEVPDWARAERLSRQLQGMTRQLEHRIAAQERLESRLAEESEARSRQQAELDHLRNQLASARADYDRLLHTKTMRVLRVPRALYGRLLRRSG